MVIYFTCTYKTTSMSTCLWNKQAVEDTWWALPEAFPWIFTRDLFFCFAICRLSLALGRAAGAKGLTKVDGRKLNVGENCIFEHNLDKTPLFHFNKGTFLSIGWDFWGPLKCSLPYRRAGLDAGVGGREGGGGGGQRRVSLEGVG